MLVLGSRILSVFAMGILFVVITQDLQIYAELIRKLSGQAGSYDPPPPGSNASDSFVTTADGERIHFRRWAPTGAAETRLRVAILSHGNAGTMDDYLAIPKWLAGKGIATYVYDYRGYGLSSGWPSERGIYQDAEAIWREAQRRDGATPEGTLVFGHSLGGGPSTYLAERHNLAVLMTAATYTSVPERAALHPLFGRLAPFVWTRFPNRERIGRLRDTCLIVLHARNDDTMPLSMAKALVAAYHGTRKALFAEDPMSGHGDIVGRVPDLADGLVEDCARINR